MKKLLFAALVLLLPAQLTVAQNDPCGLDFNVTVTRAQLTADQVNWPAIGARMDGCDRLRVLSDTAYTALIIEQAFLRQLNALSDSLVGEMAQGRDLRDELLTTQADFIAFQQQKLDEYDALLVRSNQLVEDATRNTDRALRQIRFLKFGMVGILAASLVGAVLIN